MENRVATPKRSEQVLILAYYVLMMVALGASDGLRGVFLPLFEDTFTLTKTQSSMIIMCSYVGNLVFLLIGGYFLDRMSKKRFLCMVMLLWMAALLCYITTESYPILLVAMVFSLGASTMLSTSLNVITPLLFAAPAFYINLFNFTNGVGIFAAQNIGGKVADRMQSWHVINLVLLLLGALGLCFLHRMPLPKQNAPQPKEQGSTWAAYKSILKHPACKYLICICGFYYVAEHGLQNWMVSYGGECLGLTRERAALALSIFFGGIMIGRLLFAPLVQKLTPGRSITIFAGIGAALYLTGILLGRSGIVLLMLSGLAFSILWPTIVLIIGTYYPAASNGVAVGLITAVATLFDIAFNAGFGTLVDHFGFARSIRILPLCAVLFFLCYVVMWRRTKPYAE